MEKNTKECIKKPRLIGITIVRNEEHNYLKPWLENMSKFLDYHVFVDDASDDNTPTIIQEAIKNGYKGEIHCRKTSLFKDNEPKLRGELWEYVRKVAQEDDWILIVDADEFYDQDLAELKKKIFQTPSEYGLYYIGLYDMWTKDSYRVDGYWSQNLIKSRLFRYLNSPFEGKKEIKAELHQAPCPSYVLSMNGLYAGLSFIHKSYIEDTAKKYKYDFYKKNVSPNSLNYQHALSILEEKETLKKYKEWDNKKAPKVLICSLVHNRDWMLDLFLSELKKIDYPKDKISYYFVANNISDNSLEILKKWEKVFSKEGIPFKIDMYNFNLSKKIKSDHTWDTPLIREMANMRNMHFAEAKKQHVDFVLSVDSDLLAPSSILKHLIQQEKNIISPIFYADWGEGDTYGPQVWARGGAEIDEILLQNLRKQNHTFRVGGLGAFTLISKEIWESGVNYSKVYNLPEKMFGEDRDFCTRASVMNFELWANNTYPILHIDNQELLKKYLRRGLIKQKKNEYSVLYDKYEYDKYEIENMGIKKIKIPTSLRILISLIPIKKIRSRMRESYRKLYQI